MTDFSIQPIAGVVYQGVGLGILAGVSMKTLDIVQQGFKQPKTGKKQKGMFLDLGLKQPKF